MVLLGNIGAERCRQSFSACCWWGIQGRYIDSSRQDKTSNEQTMGEFDMCEMYNFSFIGKDGDKIEPFAVFCLLQNALVIIVNGFTLIVVGRTSASYDHVTQLFFKALSSTYVCLGASFVARVACTEIVRMHHVAFKLNIAITTSFLFLSLGFLACINVNRYIMIVQPLRYHSIVTIGRAGQVVAIIAILSLSTMIGVPIPNTPYDDFAIAIENCDPVAIQAISIRLRPWTHSLVCS